MFLDTSSQLKFNDVLDGGGDGRGCLYFSLFVQVHELEAEMDSLNKPHSQFSQVRATKRERSHVLFRKHLACHQRKTTSIVL